MIRRLASLRWLQPGAVRQLHRYYQDAMTSCRPSRRTSFPSLGGTSVALVRFAPWRTSAPPRPGVGNPVSPAGNLPRRRQDLPSSWGTPIVRLHMFNPTPAGLLAPDHYGAAAWPLVCEKQRLPRKVFRRSIAWLSDSLSTLRSAGYPSTTQDSLPAAGQALPDGLSTRRVPTERFQSCFLTSHPPFPSLLAAQWACPVVEAARAHAHRCDTPRSIGFRAKRMWVAHAEAGLENWREPNSGHEPASPVTIKEYQNSSSRMISQEPTHL